MTTYIKNNTDTIIEIRDLSVTIPPSETIHTIEYCNDIEMAKSNDLVTKIATGTVSINDGNKDLTITEGIRHITEHTISSITDSSGKQRVHQTSRRLGLRIMWSGVGDDPNDVHDVGHGENFFMSHSIGEPQPESLYIDYNIVNNMTYLHEGYITWKDCNMDRLTLEMVCRPTAVEPGENTMYGLYKGYMIIPAGGDGTINVTADLTDPNAGLIYMPDNDLGESPTAFWDADYNKSTKRYENVRPNYTGQGRYNMFPAEIVFARFVNNMPLLGNGFIGLNSSDTDRMGHGMRLKMIATTNQADHAWSVACLMCMHRDSSV